MAGRGAGRMAWALGAGRMAGLGAGRMAGRGAGRMAWALGAGRMAALGTGRWLA